MKIGFFCVLYSLNCFKLGRYQEGLETRQSIWPYIEKSLDNADQAIH
jgi:hypothetical protein